MTINNNLEQYGLSEKETKIYLFLLSVIETTAHKIAKGTSIPRATVYLTLEELKKKGLVTAIRKNNIAHFLAENPNRLRKIAEEKLSLADLLIPQLKSLTSGQHFTPTAKMFTGREGVKIVFDEMLEILKDKNIKQLYTISDSEVLRILPKYFPDWVRQREKLGVSTQMLAERETGGGSPFKASTTREIRFLPEDITFDCSFNIYGDKMSCLSIKGEEIYAITIESPTVVHTVRQLFLIIWKSLERNR